MCLFLRQMSQLIITAIFLIVLLFTSRVTFGGTVWIEVEDPSPAAKSGQEFYTSLKYSSWDARVGSYSMTVQYNPELIQILDVTFPEASEFSDNAYADNNSFESGATRVSAFQTEYENDANTSQTFANIHWIATGVAGQLASIQITPHSLVDEKWRAVEVETYEVRFVISSADIETDLDDDGMDDGWETAYFGNTARDGLLDYDNDDLADLEEYEYGTNPAVEDSDGDGSGDGDEIIYHSDPTLPSDTPYNHSPDQPVIITDLTDVSLRYNPFDIESYSDPDNDFLLSSEWQIGMDMDFSQLVLNQTLEIGIGNIEQESDMLLLMMSEPLFLPDSLYWIRVRFEDSTGNLSLWSDALAFSTVIADPYDLDNNGSDDTYQINDDTDTNNNDINDIDEGILAISDPEQGEPVGITTDSGLLNSLTALSASEAFDTDPPEIPMPYGLFSFRIDDLLQGETAKISFYFPDTVLSNALWYTYLSAEGTLINNTMNATIDGNRVDLYITDGGIGDTDGVANGIIISGVAFSITSDETNDTDENDATGRDSGGGGGCFISTILN